MFENCRFTLLDSVVGGKHSAVLSVLTSMQEGRVLSACSSVTAEENIAHTFFPSSFFLSSCLRAGSALSVKIRTPATGID